MLEAARLVDFVCLIVNSTSMLPKGTFSLREEKNGFSVMEGEEVLLTLPEPFGSRVVECLLGDRDQFNCHGAADYILHHEVIDLRQLASRSVTTVNTQTVLKDRELPCGFQMQGMPIGNFFAAHSGVVLGSSKKYGKENPIVCHKVGWAGPFEITLLRDALQAIHEENEDEVLETVFY